MNLTGSFCHLPENAGGLFLWSEPVDWFLSAAPMGVTARQKKCSSLNPEL